MSMDPADIAAAMERKSLANVQWFPTEYFSGCDAEFIFLSNQEENGVHGYMEKDVASFTFAARQMTQPLYNYNDYLYMRHSRGNILVLGTMILTYTFKRRLIEKLNASVNEANGGLSLSDTAEIEAAAKEFSRLSVEDKITALVQNGAAADASITKDILEGTGPGARAQRETRFNPVDTFNVGDGGLDVVVHFGNRVKPGSTEEVAFASLKQASGVPTDLRMLTLHNVELNFLRQVIRPAAEPLADVYNFTARSIS